jgi:hypothetical protein
MIAHHHAIKAGVSSRKPLKSGETDKTFSHHYDIDDLNVSTLKTNYTGAGLKFDWTRDLVSRAKCRGIPLI